MNEEKVLPLLEMTSFIDPRFSKILFSIYEIRNEISSNIVEFFDA